MNEAGTDVQSAEIPLDRDRFMRTVVCEIADALEKLIGIEDASGYISLVGSVIGDRLNDAYRRELGEDPLTAKEVADVLVDLKRRIEGDFYIVEVSETRIVLQNRACPFGDKVKGRNSLCMMTSNVFGAIAAQNFGYANVELQNTIASGDPECRVTVHLSSGRDTEPVDGREYFSDRT